MKKPKKISGTILELHKAALAVRKKAHAPYSKFKVGAALLSDEGEIFSGCNVENASYGGTICAERAAIVKAVSSGHKKFSDILVVTDSDHPAVPCAICLQVMAEFFEPQTLIWVSNLKTVKSVSPFSEVLPFPFGPRELERAK